MGDGLTVTEKGLEPYQPPSGASVSSPFEISAILQSAGGHQETIQGPSDHEFCWEYLYLAEEIERGLARHEVQYRIHEEHRIDPPGEHVSDPIADITARLDSLGAHVQRATTVLDPRILRRAFGTNMDDGDESVIRAIALVIEDVYVSLMLWSRMARCVSSPTRFVPVYQAVSEFADLPIREIRQFSQEWSLQARDLVRARRAGLIHDPAKITLTFNVDANAQARFATALENAKK